MVKQTAKLGETSQISVGKWPLRLNVDGISNKVLSNHDSNTISVISGENYTKLGNDIPVGKDPTAIAIDEKTLQIAYL